MSRAPTNIDPNNRKRRLDEPNLEEEEDSSNVPSGANAEEDVDEEVDPDRAAETARPRSPSPQRDPIPQEAADDVEFEQYCQIRHAQPQYVRKFNIVGYKMTFDIDSMAEGMDADQQHALFLRIVQRIINETIERAHENGHVAHRLGFAFKADGMKKNEYLIPFRSVEENNARKLAEEIYNFEQSDGGVRVIGNTCQINVTVCRRTTGAGKKDGLHTKGEQADIDKALLEAVSLSRDGPDNLCLFKAIAISKRYAELKIEKNEYLNDRINSFRENKLYTLTNAVEELMDAVGIKIHKVDISDQTITYGEKEMERLQAYFDEKAPGRYRIVAFSERTDTNAIWKGPNSAPPPCIYHHTPSGSANGHYSAVKTPQKLFARGNYCIDCEVTFAHASHHTAKCKAKCINCLRVGYGYPCNGTDRIHCDGCKKIFTSRDCYEKHLEFACRMYKRCETCGKYWRPDLCKPKPGEPAPTEPKHQCDLHFCHDCRMPHRKGVACFVSKPTIPGNPPYYRIVSWDYECQVHRKVDKDDRKTLHEPNYVAAVVTCSKCISEGRWQDLDRADCPICGPQKVYAKGEWECPDGLTKQLVDWLLKLPKKYTTYAYAHNAAHYDDQFVMQELYNRGGIKPNILSNGNKLFEVKLRRTNRNGELILRDSNLLFPMKLSAVKDTFRLGCEPKPWFPYRYNRRDNYGTLLVGLPPKEDYCPGNLTEKELKQFEAWYSDQRKNWTNVRFDLKKELSEYCMSDCVNLLHALVAFRKLFNGVSHFDNFVKSCTLTSGCLRIYKHRFMKPKTIGIIPPHGYGPFERQSNKGMKFVKWVAKAHGVEVKHRDNGGEKEIKHTEVGPGGRSVTYKLDGFIDARERQSANFKKCGIEGCVYCEQAPDNDVAIEFNGCYFHGCDVCMKNDCKGVGGRSTDELWQHTLEREERLKQHNLFVWRVQECVFDKHFKKNDEMKAFFERECFDTGPIVPRDAFFGGRVHPTCRHYKPREHEEIKYMDVCSLYPYVLTKPFPVGHPARLRGETLHDDGRWTKPSDYSWKGIIKCIVIPPKSLEIPVLPMRDADRLCFPLCRACTIDSRKTSAFNANPVCNHSDRERAFVTTTTHMELDMALMMGYKVNGIMEVWHWDEWSEDLFSGYIREFYKIKEEASGWKGCTTDAQKDAHIQAIFKKTGVLLDKDKVEDNPGLRYVAKLCLNSLWGRFAMRTDRANTEIIWKASRLNDLFDNPSVEVQSIIQLNEEAIKVSWKHRNRFEKPDPNSNLVIAIFTTAYGRMELYRHIRAGHENIGGAIGARKLCCDTDSVLIKQRKDNPAIIPGNSLGEMTDEYEGKTILEYVGAGCKQYALRYSETVKGDDGVSRTVIKETIKNRGFTFKTRANNVLDCAKMAEMVHQADQCKPIGVNTMEFPTDAWNNVFTVEFDKQYQPRYNKSWINHRTRSQKCLPHGYRRPQNLPEVSYKDLEVWLANHPSGVPFRNPHWDPAIFEWRPEDRVTKVDAQGVPLCYIPRMSAGIDEMHRCCREVDAHRWDDGYGDDGPNAAMEVDDNDGGSVGSLDDRQYDSDDKDSHMDASPTHSDAGDVSQTGDFD